MLASAHPGPTPPAVPTRSRRPGPLALLALLIVAAALLRFWRIGHQGFWYDESDTALLMHYSAGGMLGLIPKTESTPPLYYCLAWVWSRVLGNTEAPLRSLSALAGVLVVPAIYVAAARLTDSRRTAVAAAALAAFNPLLIWYSQEARAYELLVLFASLAWLAFAFALEDANVRWLAAWALLSGLGLTTHYYAVLVVVPQAVVLLWRWRRRRAAWAAVAFVTIVFLALLPLLLVQDKNANWIAQVSLGLRLSQLLPQFLIGTGTPARTLLKFVCFALVLGGLVSLAWLRPRRGLLVAAMTLAGFLLSLLFVVGGSDTLLTRNLIGLWPGAAIAVAAGLGAVRPGGQRGWLAPGAVAGLCVAGAIATIGVATTYALQRPNWRPLAALLTHERPDANRLILIQHYGYDLPLALYMPKLGFAREPRYSDVTELDVVALGHEPGPPECWWGSGCNLSPTTLQPTYRIDGFRAVGIHHVEQFSVVTLVADRPQTVSRAELAAALVTTTLARDVLLVQRS